MADAKKSPAKIQLRRAVAEDVVNVFKLVKRQSAIPETETPANNHGIIAHYLDMIERGYVIVASLSGRIVGAVGCGAHFDGPRGETHRVGLLAEDPSFGTVGLRSALLNKLATYLKAKNRILIAAVGTSPAGAELEDELVKLGFGLAEMTYEYGYTDDAEQEPELPPDEPDGAYAPDDHSAEEVVWNPDGNPT
jgi:hypothetical protein